MIYTYFHFERSFLVAVWQIMRKGETVEAERPHNWDLWQSVPCVRVAKDLI